MKGVFGKIFLAFCGTICAGVLLSALVLGWLFPRKDWLEGWRQASHHMVILAAVTGVQVYEEHGPDALARFVQELERDRLVRYFFLDASGRELLGRSLPQDFLENPYKPFPFATRLRQRLLPSPIEIIDIPGTFGTRYTLVRHLLAPMPPLPRSRLIPQVVSLGALVAVASILCFFLARHFVAPLRTLQQGACLLASGDFSIRVGPSLHRRHDEFGALARDFDLMAEKLGRLVEAQRQLLRDISHELRSPLTRLGVALELTRKQAPRELSPFFDRIEKESERLNTLISQVLILARLDHGESTFSFDRVALDQIVEEVARDADFEAQGKGCTVRWFLEPAEVLGSAELLRSAVENVLRNAVRYSPHGTEITVTVNRVVAKEDECVEIRVEDQGPGVPESRLEEIFRPFYRVAEARDRGSGGAGLGLAIAQKAVQRHGGKMRAVNRPEGGLCVLMQLPIAPQGRA
ncbi:MAG: ATP-binding protein [Desulfosoma sp.]